MSTFPATRPWHDAEDWEAQAGVRGLSERERSLVGAFRRDGYVIVEDARILDGIDTNGIWAELATQFAEDGSGRVQDAWQTNDAVRAIAAHPAVLEVLQLLYGRKPYPFQTLNFLNGTEQPTHSDVIHFSSLPSGFMCGVWMALEDITLRQGPLHYYAGSQRLPEFDYEDLGIPAIVGEQTWQNPNTPVAYRRYEVQIDALARGSGLRREQLAIARGSFLIWSANLMHGGDPRSDRTLTRKSQVTHYYFSDSVPYTPMFSRRSENTYAVRRVRDIGTGSWVVPSLDGNPVVFPRASEGRRAIVPVAGFPGAMTRALNAHAVRAGLPGSPPNAAFLAARAFIAGMLR